MPFLSGACILRLTYTHTHTHKDPSLVQFLSQRTSCEFLSPTTGSGGWIIRLFFLSAIYNHHSSCFSCGWVREREQVRYHSSKSQWVFIMSISPAHPSVQWVPGLSTGCVSLTTKGSGGTAHTCSESVLPSLPVTLCEAARHSTTSNLP